MNNGSILLKSRHHPLAVLIRGQALVALANLAYGKLTALYISPAEWGNYSLVLTFVMLLHGFVITPTIQSFKASLTGPSPKIAVSSYSQILALIYAVSLLVAGFVASVHHNGFLWIAAWLSLVGQGVYNFSNDYLNVMGRYRAYSGILLLYALGNLILFGIVVVSFGQSTTLGLFLNLALLNVALAIVAVRQAIQSDTTFRFRIQRLSNRYSPDLLRQYQRYVWPLMSLAVWNWLINYADRQLIKYYMTDTDVGQYVMGYSLGSKLLLLVAPLIAFLSPIVFRFKSDGYSDGHVNKFLVPYLKQYAAVVGSVCLLFVGLHRLIGATFLSSTYESAYVVGPIVAVGYLFLTCIQVLEIKWYAYGQTRFILWHTVVGAIVNVLLNIVLIPRLGIVGAALATLLGFAIQFLAVLYLFFRKQL
ncbi:polysaccharide biosynthesis C-terminal domain-containing protein [Spirosoma sp. BT702]|uniref:Polysaccharide biosynthesis C-terminal domain-containing protein n=1 Tax=Spirosoma profusum TaxID=2771354 RepID=A0A927GA52_9BACT|nr:polysaccharide biosynthesis C-terminal domain-containing protein [Spirosoma profusum]MBD2704800.1 polysaccharide biosynthesis C-terminal domain-containing protein [Spirosoma profusum]